MTSFNDIYKSIESHMDTQNHKHTYLCCHHTIVSSHVCIFTLSSFLTLFLVVIQYIIWQKKIHVKILMLKDQLYYYLKLVKNISKFEMMDLS